VALNTKATTKSMSYTYNLDGSVATATYPRALEHLQPLTTPPNKALLIETHSRWTAFFDNGLRMSDPESAVGHLYTIVPCKGVVAHCAPDRSETKDPDALRIYGIVSFGMFTTHQQIG
jgi:hypothetical protein